MCVFLPVGVHGLVTRGHKPTLSMAPQLLSTLFLKAECLIGLKFTH